MFNKITIGGSTVTGDVSIEYTRDKSGLALTVCMGTIGCMLTAMQVWTGMRATHSRHEQ